MKGIKDTGYIREFDPRMATEKITTFIKNYMDNAGFSRAVIGLSGGLDSATCAFVVARAIGSENVSLINMPYRASSPESREDAELVAKSLGIELDILDITDPVDAFFEHRSRPDRLRLGNACARMRMIALYDIAAEKDALVVATGNKSERYLGYTTLWGDMAGAYAPIGDLFKTDEKALAAFLGVPDKLINKTPTADLWADQTDEGEMGITYQNADRIIHMIYEQNMTPREVTESGESQDDVDTVITRYRASRFKTRLPVYPSLAD